MAVCGMCCLDLNNDTLKILGTQFSYNEKLKEGKTLCKTSVTDIQQLFKIWKIRNCTREGTIIIFKTIVISKIVFQLYITVIPKHIINDLEKVEKAFLWINCMPKIEHETPLKDYKNGGF